MATQSVHLDQARHNEETENHLLKSGRYHDWGVTAAFYAAIHFYEGWLYKTNVEPKKKHSETSIPRDQKGKMETSVHGWRESNIRNLGNAAFKSYRKLKVASETARYLSVPNITPPFAQQIAPLQITPIDAKAYIEQDLSLFKKELGIG